MGVIFIFLSWVEVYSGLQQCVIDGVEVQYVGIYGVWLYEVIGYVNKICYIYLIFGLVVSNYWFSCLSKVYQNLV